MPLEYWEGMNIRTSKGEIDWGAIADRQMRACRKVGIYNEDRVRRRGAWLDEGRCVLH